MPLLTIFTAPTDVRDGDYPTQFHPGNVVRLELRYQRNAKTTVAREYRGMWPIFRPILAISEHHRHPRPIFALIKHLLEHEVRRVYVHFRLVNRLDPTSQNIVAIIGVWAIVAGEYEKRLFVGLFTAETISRTLTGKFNLAERLSC